MELEQHSKAKFVTIFALFTVHELSEQFLWFMAGQEAGV